MRHARIFAWALLLALCLPLSHATAAGVRYDLGPYADDTAAEAAITSEGWTKTAGQCYWNTTSQKRRCWNGAAWIDGATNEAVSGGISGTVGSVTVTPAADLDTNAFHSGDSMADLSTAVSDGDVQPQRAATLYVDATNGSDASPSAWGYKTISGALSAASSGDTVLLTPETYTEDIIIPEGVRVLGEFSTLTGTVTLAGTDSFVRLYTQTVATGTTGVTLAGVNTTGYAEIGRQINAGTADGISVTDSASTLFYSGVLQTIVNGEGLSSGSAGSVWYDLVVQDVSGTGTCVYASPTADAAGYIGTCDDDGSGVGLYVEALGSMRLDMVRLDANTAYQVEAGAELDLTVDEIVGAEVNAGTTIILVRDDVAGWVDQDVTSGASPVLAVTNMTGSTAAIDSTAVHTGDACGGGLGGTFPDCSVTPAAGLDTDATAHAASDGTSHTYIDQDVTSGAAPVFAVTNMTGSAAGIDSDATTHAAATGNPHATDVGNLGTGTLAELNTAITDATLVDGTKLADYDDGTAGYLATYGAGAWGATDPSSLGPDFVYDVDLSGTYDWQANGSGSEDTTSGFTAYGDVTDATTLEVGAGVISFDVSGGGAGVNKTVYLSIPLGTDYDAPGLYEAAVLSILASIDLDNMDNQNNCEITFRLSDQDLHTTPPTEQATIRILRTGGGVSANLTREVNDVVTTSGNTAWAGWANASSVGFRDGVGRMAGQVFETGSNTLTSLTTNTDDDAHVRSGGTGAPFLSVTITAIGDNVSPGRVAGTISTITARVL